MKYLTLFAGLAAMLAVGCAHQDAAPRGSFTHPSVPSRGSYPDWTGFVRVNLDDLAALDITGDSRAGVASLVRQLMSELGVAAQVDCLEIDQSAAGSGAFHARLRVRFISQINEDRHEEALRLLGALAPTQDAYSERM